MTLEEAQDEMYKLYFTKRALEHDIEKLEIELDYVYNQRRILAVEFPDLDLGDPRE